MYKQAEANGEPRDPGVEAEFRAYHLCTLMAQHGKFAESRLQFHTSLQVCARPEPPAELHRVHDINKCSASTAASSTPLVMCARCSNLAHLVLHLSSSERHLVKASAALHAALHPLAPSRWRSAAESGECSWCCACAHDWRPTQIY